MLEEVKELISELEIWDSLQMRQPLTHKSGGCQCPSKGENTQETGRLEPATKEERNTVTDAIKTRKERGLPGTYKEEREK